jgi:hypothetical protein
MEYQDKILICVEENCETLNKEFTVTADAQRYLEQQGWPLPKRCKDCREKKKNRANSPFRVVADQFKRGDYGHNKKKENHRRTGRERMDDFEGNKQGI